MIMNITLFITTAWWNETGKDNANDNDKTRKLGIVMRRLISKFTYKMWNVAMMFMIIKIAMMAVVVLIVISIIQIFFDVPTYY